MAIKMNKEHGQYKYLTTQQKKKDLYTGKYLEDEHSDHYKFMLEHIFKGECKVYDTNIVNSGWFKLVADKYAQYVGNPCWDIKYNFFENVVDFTAMSKSIIMLERTDDGLEWKYIKAEKHVKIDGEDYIFTIFKETDGIIFKNDYTLIQRFYMEGDTQFIENNLYKGIHTGIVKSSTQPLDSIPQTRGMDPIVNTGLSKALFVHERDQISKFEEIKRTVFSQDRIENMIDNELLSNIEKYTIINGINPKNAQSVDDILDTKTIINLSRGKDDGTKASVDFVGNKNDLVDTAIDYSTDKRVSKMVSMTSIPSEFFGGNRTGSVSTESRKLMYDDFTAFIESVRDFFDEQISEIVEVMKEETRIQEYNYVWGDVIKKDKKQLLEELKMAQECGYTTKKEAIKRYMDITDPKELDKFILELKAENDNRINTDGDQEDSEEDQG